MRERTKILAIDDDPSNLFIISEILGSMFDVKTCTCGLDCVETLQQFKADIVLLDISMPEISGYEVCKNIRQYEEFADIGIMFLSGLNHVEDRLAGYEAGGDDYICKPFDYEELLAKIKVYLKKRDRFQDAKIAPEKQQPDSPQQKEYLEPSSDQNTLFQSQLKKFSRYTNSVLYVQADFPHCSVFCKKDEQSPLKLRGTLKKIEESLKDESFIRVHRSYLINPDKIQSIKRKGSQDMEIFLVDNNEQTIGIPVGRKYRKLLKSEFSKFFN